MDPLRSAAAAAVAVILLSGVAIAADVTVNLTTSIEGGLAAGPTGNGMAPKVVTKISGSKSRTDVDTGDQAVSTIIDTATNQAYVLHHGEKKGMQFSTEAAPPGQSGPAGQAAPPAVEAEVKPTGMTREIDGVSCVEYAVSMKMDMAAMAAGGGSALPPEAGAMLKDVFVRITGSTWVAKDGPGSAEYAAYQKATARVAMAAMSRMSGSGGASSPIPSGLERLVTGFPEAQGIPYLTELTTAVEGSGQFVSLLQGMAKMKIVSRVTGVSTEPIAPDTFNVPEGYTIVKQ